MRTSVIAAADNWSFWLTALVSTLENIPTFPYPFVAMLLPCSSFVITNRPCSIPAGLVKSIGTDWIQQEQDLLTLLISSSVVLVAHVPNKLTECENVKSALPLSVDVTRMVTTTVGQIGKFGMRFYLGAYHLTTDNR